MADVAPIVQETDVPIQRPSSKRQREEDSESDDEPRQFRRVRVRCCQRAERQSGRDDADVEALKSGQEIIRCVCGTQDDLELLENDSDDAPSVRRVRAWLIQCGDCKVWQHRSCVGTANGKDPTGGFYCERCPKVKPTRPHSSPTSSRGLVSAA